MILNITVSHAKPLLMSLKSKEEIAENPNTIGLWQTLIAKYPGATIIHECEMRLGGLMN